MSKNRPKPPPAPPERPVSPSRAPQPRHHASKPNLFFKLVASVVASWHLLAVFMAPLSLPPTSQLVATIAQGPVSQEAPLKWNEASPMQWYLDALYLNHGYHFFAPSPGAGHIIRYQVTDERGELIAEGEFPDPKEYWPRLRYHRHFMLSDQAQLPLPRREADAAQRYVLEGYARHLLRTLSGAEARLTRVRHYMLSPQEKVQGIELDAPHKYETVMEAVQDVDDLASTAPTPSGQAELGARNFAGALRRTR